MSRFTRRFSDQELLAIVRRVSSSASPEKPEAITQRAYDAARVTAGEEGTPRADRIAAQLESSWSEVLRLALRVDNPEQILGARSAPRTRGKLTEAEVIHYLKRVSESLGVESLSEHDYAAERQRIINRDSARWLHGGAQAELVPTAATIIAVVGSWDRATRLAGLQPAKSGKLPTYPLESALDDFIADYGWVPRHQHLLAYQARRNLSTPNPPQRWEVWIRRQLRSGPASQRKPRRRLKRGEKPPAGWEEQEITPAPKGYLTLRRSSRDPITVSECEQSLERALELAEGERLTQRLYIRLAKENGLASLSSIQDALAREGSDLTWGKLRDRVISERSRRRR